MGTVKIPDTTGVDYAIYGTKAAAESYLQADLDYYAAWAALSTDNKSRTLVKSYRFLSALPWRTDVTPATEDTVVEASYMLSGYLAVNPGGLGGPGGGSPSEGAVSSVSDTVSRMSFFHSGVAVDARRVMSAALPRDILAKIRLLLRSAVAGTSAVPFASGTDGESQFTDDKKFDLIDNVTGVTD